MFEPSSPQRLAPPITSSRLSGVNTSVAILGNGPLQHWAAIAAGDSEALQQLVQTLLGPRHPAWILLDAQSERLLGETRMAHPARQIDALFAGRLHGCLQLAEKTPLLHHDAAIGAHLGLALSLFLEARTQQLLNERFRLIAQIGALVATETDLDALLARAADLVHERLAYPNVDIPLYDADRDELVIRFRGGHYKASIQGEDRLPTAQGIMGSAVRERRTQRVNDIANDPRYACPPGVVPARAELAVPIMHGAEVLGVLNVESEHPFDDSDAQSLEIVAEYLGAAIMTARLQAQARQAAVMSERQRLARELHDNVTQLLSSINLIAQSLSSAWQRNPEEGQRRTGRLQELVGLSLVEMRALLRELGPTERNTPGTPAQSDNLLAREQLRRDGLAATIERLARLSAPEGLQLRIDFGGYLAQDPVLEETLLRIAQEAISNAIRHARARRLSIAARVDGGMVELIIGDDGRGIDPRHRHGLGLQHMRDRAAEAGGRMQLQEAQPHGTRVIARVPGRAAPHSESSS